MRVQKQDLSQAKKWYDFGEQKSAKKARKISLITFFTCLIFAFIGDYLGRNFRFPNIVEVLFIIIIAIGLGLSLVFLLFIYNKRFYNNFIYLLILIIASFFSWRSHVIEGSALIMTSSMFVASIGFLLLGFMAWFSIKNNQFLRIFGFLICFIFILIFLGGLFKIMHFPGAFTMISIGITLFVFSVFSLIFTLPNSSYLSWTKFHKRFFYRAIIVPMSFIFIVVSVIFAFPKVWNYMWDDSKSVKNWNIDKIELKAKEGIEIEGEN